MAKLSHLYLDGASINGLHSVTASYQPRQACSQGAARSWRDEPCITEGRVLRAKAHFEGPSHSVTRMAGITSTSECLCLPGPGNVRQDARSCALVSHAGSPSPGTADGDTRGLKEHRGRLGNTQPPQVSQCPRAEVLCPRT